MPKFVVQHDNSIQDAYALEHGEAHFVEFPLGVDVGKHRCYVAYFADRETAKQHAALGNGTYRGFIRAADFGY